MSPSEVEAIETELAPPFTVARPASLEAAPRLQFSP